MANADRPSGLKPYGAILRASRYIAGATVYPGDAVRIQADGAVDPATAGQSVVGVAAEYATVGQDVMVWDDPSQKFIVQDDGVSATIAQTDVGLNYNFVATAGDATYKQSRMELDADSGATASTLPLRLVGFDREQGNVAGSANAACIVVVNQHQLDANIEGA